MKIMKPAVAGTLESSDAMISIEPGEKGSGIQLELESSVIEQYGRKIKEVVLETLKRLEVEDAVVRIVDKGALDCTLKARVECAVYRSNDKKADLPWGGVIRS